MRQFNLFVATGVVVRAPRDGKFSFRARDVEIEAVLDGSQARAAARRLVVDKEILLSGKLTANGGGRPRVSVERLQILAKEKTEK